MRQQHDEDHESRADGTLARHGGHHVVSGEVIPLPPQDQRSHGPAVRHQPGPTSGSLAHDGVAPQASPYPGPAPMQGPVPPHAPVPPPMMAPPMPIPPEQKSIAISLVLTFFFGPLGMLYSTVLGFVVMLLINLVVLPLTLGIGIVLTWPACMVWAALAASDHNAKVRHQWAAQQAFQHQQAQFQQHAYHQQQNFAHQQQNFEQQQRAFAQQAFEQQQRAFAQQTFDQQRSHESQRPYPQQRADDAPYPDPQHRP